MKFPPHVVHGEKLAGMACDQLYAAGDFPEVLTPDGEAREDSFDSWFVVQWPDFCVTEKHLGDATIHGPYDSQAEAARAWDIDLGSEVTQ